MELTPAQRQDLRDEGRWEEFLRLCEVLTSEGATKEKAEELAWDEVERRRLMLFEKQGRQMKRRELKARKEKREEGEKEVEQEHEMRRKEEEEGGAMVRLGVVTKQLADVPPTPKEVLGREAENEAENIRWVLDHIMPDTDLSECPSPLAWLDVFLCRADDAYRSMYLKEMRGKLIPNRAQILPDDEEGKIDGALTVEVLHKVKAASEEAQKGKKGKEADADLG